MFIQIYSDYELKPAVARRFVSKVVNADKLVYTLAIGSPGVDLWLYYMSIGKSILKNIEGTPDEIVLDKNSYTIRPIRDANKNVIKDKKGNIRYRIEEDPNTAFKNDMILLVELPNKNYLEIKYRLEGDVSLLAEACTGKERQAMTFKSPALVLEVTGDFKLVYEAKDQNGNLVTGAMSYDYTRKTFNPIDKE